MAVGFNTADSWQAAGRGFSMGIVAGPGVPVFLTGQVAWNAAEEVVGSRDVAEQARQCFRNIEALLGEVGGGLRDLVDTTTYLLDARDLPKVQAVRTELSLDPAPASTSIIVAALGHSDFLVEIKAVAVVPHERYRDPPSRP